MSPEEYVRASFDPDVVGPPGTCWLFTLADVALACGGIPAPAPWWLVALLDLGFYVWTVPMRWVRCNVIGSIGSDETFVHALSMDAGADTGWVDSAALHDIAVTVASVWDGFMGLHADKFSTNIKYVEVGASLLQQTSVGGDVDTILGTEFAPINGDTGRQGTSSDPQLPNETSMAFSWETGTRGRRGRGRTYLPPLTSTDLTGEGRFTAARCTSFANYAKDTMIPGMNGGAGTWQFAIRSGADMALYPVTGVRVSDVPDSQRRRRRSQVPVFHEGT